MIAKLVTNSQNAVCTSPSSLEVVSADDTTKFLNILSVELEISRSGLYADIESHETLSVGAERTEDEPRFDRIMIGDIIFPVRNWTHHTIAERIAEFEAQFNADLEDYRERNEGTELPE